MEKMFYAQCPGDTWTLTVDCAQRSSGLLLEITCAGEDVLRLRREDGRLRLRFFTRWEGTTRSFGESPAFAWTLEADASASRLCVTCDRAAIRLFDGSELADEEWLLGACAAGEWAVRTGEDVSGYDLRAGTCAVCGEERRFTGPMQFFVPAGYNAGVGDCMPFSREGRYCLYYLFDRRGHASKQRLGAHQWGQISSADLKTWTVHPLAIPITEQWEGSICTGSLIRREDRFFAFYAVRMADGSPARLTWAVSEDGVHFRKAGRFFTLTHPYEPISARDPMVFEGADGLYHMLVTTSLADGGPYGGCLAHLTSADLERWTQQAPFIVPGYADQPECSDYFEWNGYYYLVFSNFATARYRISRGPFGPWMRPKDDILDTIESQVAKTAPFQGRRLVTGFLCRRPRTYAGNAVTHELFQRQDGTLGVRFVEEILPALPAEDAIEDFSLQAEPGRAWRKLACPQGAFRLRLRIRPHSRGTLYGITLQFGEEQEPKRTYRIDFDPASKSVAVLRPDEQFELGASRNRRAAAQGVDEEIAADILVQEDMLDMALSNGQALTLRLEDRGACRVGVYALAGEADFSQIRIGRQRRKETDGAEDICRSI